MISFDYTIKRDEKDGVVLYQPSFNKELDDLTYIEAPNSTGKSTLLNVIALAMQGSHKGTRIKKELQQEIRKLIESEHQDISFKVQITSKDNSIILLGEKELGSPEIKTYEIIGKKKTHLQGPAFANKYNLIYEIPSNPTKKLDNMLNTLSLFNNLYGSKIRSFVGYIENVLTELEQDPKHKLPEWDKSLKKHEKQLKENEKEEKKVTELHKSLEYYTYVKLLRESVEERNEEDKKLKRLKKQQKSEQEKIPDHGGELMKIRNQRDELTSLFRETGKYVKPLLTKKHKTALEIWRSIGFERVMKDCELDPALRGVITQTQLIIENEEKKARSDGSYKNAELIQALINALEEFQDMDCEVPESGLLISDYINKLKDRMKEHESLVSLVNNASTALDLLRQLETRANHFDNFWIEKLKESKEALGKPQDYGPDLTPEITRAEAQLKIIGGRINEYESRCVLLGVDVKNINRVYKQITMTGRAEDFSDFESYTDEQLLTKVRALNERISELNKKGAKLEYMANEYRKKIDDAKKGKEHELASYIEQIKTFEKKTKELQALFDIHLMQTISHLHEKDKKSIDISEEKTRISYAISKYMARSLKTVLYNKDTFTVKTLDFLDGKIETEEGKDIWLKDLGTGHGQSLYLRGLLETTDQRKIILLLDEVAMMDPNTLKTVLNSIIGLHNNGKLLAAVVVQMGKQIKLLNIKDMASGV